MDFKYKNYFSSLSSVDDWERTVIIESGVGGIYMETPEIILNIHSKRFSSEKYEAKRKLKETDPNIEWGRDDCYDISDESILIPFRCLPYLLSVFQKIML